MFTSGFEEENAVFHPPQGMSAQDVETVGVFKGKNTNGHKVIISCFKVTPEELDEITRTGRVWLHILGWDMPPCSLSGHHPFSTSEEEVRYIERISKMED